MNNSVYIDLNSWEICANPKGFIPVDVDIAKTILLLNKKGYITKSSCAGHHDIKFIDMDGADIANLAELEKDPEIIVKEIRDTEFDYWKEIGGSVIYVVFNDCYDFPNIPDGFTLEDGNYLSHKVNFYDHAKKRIAIPLINKEIKKYNKILYEWANNLPNIKEG